MSSDNPELDTSASQNNQADANHQSDQPASDSADLDTSASLGNQADGKPQATAGLRPVRPLAIGAGALVFVLLIIGISRLTGGGGGPGLTSAGQSALAGTGQSGLIGKWQQVYYSDDSGTVGGNGVATFNADGTCTTNELSSGDTCTYSVDGDTLSMTSKSQGGQAATVAAHYSLAGDVLTLTESANDVREVDVRVGGSANAASVAATAVAQATAAAQ